MGNSILEDVLVASGYGGFTSSITKTFGGIDHRRISSPFQKNTDSEGLVFMSKPNLNLSRDNLISSRLLSPLNRDPQAEGVKDPKDIESLSVMRAIKSYLDPRSRSQGVSSDLVDPNNPFICLLSNTLLSLSGWPDITLDTYVSPPDARKGSFGMVDSVAETNETFTLTATLANIEGDPCTRLLHYWTTYIGLNYAEEDIMPYPETIVTNEKDYETRIWRIVLDKSQRYVRKIASTIAFPLVTPISLSLNYARENAFATDNDQLTVPFFCQFAEYDDPILYEEFNLQVQRFNKAMTDDNRESMMVKLSPNEIRYFNFDGYPRINPVTLEMEWWVPKELYDIRTTQVFSDFSTKRDILEDNGYIPSVSDTNNPGFTAAEETQITKEVPIAKSPPEVPKQPESSQDWFKLLVDAKERGAPITEQLQIVREIKAAEEREKQVQ